MNERFEAELRAELDHLFPTTTIATRWPDIQWRAVEVASERFRSQLRRGTIPYCVLALLRNGEMYGFEITRVLAARRMVGKSGGTVYPLLARLSRAGLVETSWRESKQGPPRRYYLLTARGVEALAAFVGHWRRFRDTVDDVLETAGDRRHGDRTVIRNPFGERL